MLEVDPFYALNTTYYAVKYADFCYLFHLHTLRILPYRNGAQQPCSFATACDNSGGTGKQLVSSLIVQCTADQVSDPTALLTIT
jgi:hypothetical protein